MTIKELLQKTERDYDIYDKEFDQCVTCVDIYPIDEDEAKDPYYQIMDKVMSEVDILSWSEGDVNATADWSGWIEKHHDALDAFTRNHWHYIPSDPDDFTEAWIREIHLYFAGYGNDGTYKMFWKEVLS